MENNIKEIVLKIKKGLLCRDTDELYAGGFWDLAMENINLGIELVEKIYENYWSIYETL